MTTLLIFPENDRKNIMAQALKCARKNFNPRLIYRDEHVVSFPFNTQYFYNPLEILEKRYPEELMYGCHRLIVHETCRFLIPEERQEGMKTFGGEG